MWWDEGVSVYLTTVGVSGLTVAKDFAVDLHPPGYYLALSIWRLLFGPSVFVDRLLSAFVGTLSVPIVFVLTRRLARGIGRSTWLPAVVAALLAAISPMDVFYSQEIRMYPFLPVLGGLSLLATLNVLERGKRRDWVIWTLLAVASLYLYYYLGLLVAAEALALAVVWRRGQILPWVIAQGAVVLALAPWLVLLARRMGQSHLALPLETEVHLTPLRYLVENGLAFTVGFTLPPLGRLLAGVWLVAAFLGVVALAARPSRLALVLAAIVVPLLAAYGVLLARPFFYPRFILFAIVPLWALVAIGLTASRRALPMGLLVVVVLGAGSLWTWHAERVTPRTGYAPDNYRAVFATVAPALRRGDVVVGGYPWQAGYVDAYLGQFGVHGRYQPGPIDAARLGALARSSGRAWLLTYAPDGKFLPGELDRLAGANGRVAFVDQNGDTRMTLVEFGPPTNVPAQHALAALGDDVALASASFSPRSAHPGTTVQVNLHWRALARPAGSYTVFVHLLGPDGKVVAQRDAPPLAGAAPTTGWNAGEQVVDRYRLSLPANAPSGHYRIEVGMYRPETGQRLAVRPAQTDNRVIVGEFDVVR